MNNPSLKKTVNSTSSDGGAVINSLKENEAMESGSIKDKSFSQLTNVSDILDKIRSNEFQSKIENIRVEKDTDKGNGLKKELPVFTLGVSKDLQRGKDSFSSSGYILLDFDHVGDNLFVEKKIDEIARDPDVRLVFKSPSGDGIKVGYKLSEKLTDSEHFSSVYKIIADEKGTKYGLDADTTSDCLRLCYYSWDPDARYNEESKLVAIPKIEGKREYKKSESVKKESHDNKKISLSSTMLSILEFLSKVKLSNSDWGIIGLYLCNITDGEEIFVKYSLNNQNYNDTEEYLRDKFQRLMKDYKGSESRPKFNTILGIAKNYGFVSTDFLEPDEDGKFKVNPKILYKDFFSSEGVGMLNNNLVRIQRNIVSNISTRDLMKITENYVNDTTKNEIELEQKLNSLYTFSGKYFNSNMLQWIDDLDIEFLRDTETSTYLIFRNCAVIVSKDGISTSPLEDLANPVLKDNIIDRDFELSKVNDNFSFGKFLENATSEEINSKWIPNQMRYNSLISSIGYLISSFKDPADAKAVVLIDEITSGELNSESNGGTGKTLVTKAIGQIVNTVVLSGKKISGSSKFMYQTVGIDTRMITINDMKKNFDFEHLFDSITEGLEVEKKGQTPFTIPFAEAPKIVITTNRVLGNDDTSTKRRIHQVVFSHYYNISRTPVSEFEQRFFGDWETDTWLEFDNFMVKCVQFYLNYGLVTDEKTSYEMIMLSKTNLSFIEFSSRLECNEKYLKKDLLLEFKQEYPRFRDLSAHKFKKYLDAYALANNLEVEHSSSNSKAYVKFTSKESEEKGDIHKSRLPRNRAVDIPNTEVKEANFF